MNREGLPRQEDLAALRALEEMERNPAVSQRSLSRTLGVSLGLTNLLIRRMARKAWIKVTTMPGNRVMYNLTPQGIAEKARKTRDFLRHSLRYYFDMRRMITDQIKMTRRARPVVAVFGGEEFLNVVEEASRNAGGTFAGPISSAKGRVDVVVALSAPSKAERSSWERDKISIVDLT